MDVSHARPANTAGLLIRSEIHKARPDVHAVCHPHTIAWSAFAKPLDMIYIRIYANFHNALAVYADYGGIVFAAEEGKNIAKAMGKNSKVCQALSLPTCVTPVADGHYF
jgi:ribulose-5-phosphate 4-epimerase/fuculose-1-phosphate aldolase